jgi:hypothetical protein
MRFMFTSGTPTLLQRERGIVLVQAVDDGAEAGQVLCGQRTGNVLSIDRLSGFVYLYTVFA